MNSVWLRTRAELRSGWRQWLALAILLGLAGGAVTAAAAGARRTQSAYPRFLAAQRAMDLVLGASGGFQGLPELDRAERLPQVADSARVYLVPGRIHTPSGREVTFPDIFPLIDPAGRFGVSFNKLKILSGRAPDPDRSAEVAVSFAVADKLRLRVGDSLRYELFRHDAEGNFTTLVLTTMTLQVVGIEAAPGEFQTLGGQSITAIHLSPALARRHPDAVHPNEQSLIVRLQPGTNKVQEFFNEVERRGIGVEPAISLVEQTVDVQRSNQFQSVALWLIAGLIALTALAVFGQTLARQSFLESIEYPTLRALGMSQGELFAVGLLRTAGIALLATAISVGFAIGLSPLTPTGLARIAEPDPGFSIDAPVLALGAAALIVLTLLVALIPAYRAAAAAGSALGTAKIAGEGRASRLGTFLSSLGLPRTAVIGARMATEPGRGRTAVPVRTAILGTTFGIATIVAALTFSASLNNLVRSPQLYGWNWDSVVGPPSDRPSQAELDDATASLKRNPDVREFAAGTADTLIIRGTPLLSLALEAGGSIEPAMVEGESPFAENEIVLGTDTMRSLGIDIGDTIEVRGGVDLDAEEGAEGRLLRMRVVGRMVMPSFFFSFNRPGQGAAVTLAGMKLLRPAAQGDAFFVRYREGVARRAADHRLEARGLFVLPARETDDLVNLRRVSNIPLILAGLLAAMAAATLAHALITSIRRRRRDFALLRTLGFVRRQVQITVAWQASALALVALAIGVPVGVAAGRWGWRLFTDSLGVVPQPVVSWVVLSLLIPATLLLANLIAFVPGRIAGRVRPAAVLRTE